MHVIGLNQYSEILVTSKARQHIKIASKIPSHKIKKKKSILFILIHYFIILSNFCITSFIYFYSFLTLCTINPRPTATRTEHVSGQSEFITPLVKTLLKRKLEFSNFQYIRFNCYCHNLNKWKVIQPFFVYFL